MKKLKLRILLTAAALVTLAGGMVLTPAAHAAQTLLWSDEFNGTSVDTSQWTVYNQADGSDSWYSPTNVTESGGELRIANVQQTSGSIQWGGGGMESKVEFPQYCYLEARLKFSSRGSYDWGTWWTVGESGGSFIWPPEMDICELQGGSAGATNGPGQTYWWNWSGSGNADAGGSTYVDESQWHTYGVYWNSNSSPIFYVDGLMNQAPVGPDEGDQYGAILKFTSSPNSNTRVSGCPLATMEVDYCRVYDSPPAQPAHVSHLALNKPVTASSYKNTGGIPDRAVDGADSSGSVTRWESNWQDPQWLCVDLQAICSINEVILNWQYAAASSYQIQVSSDSWGPWTNCITVTGGTYGWVTNSFPAQTGRYVRLYGTTRTTPYGYSLFDMQVYGTVVNPNPGDPPARPNLALNQPTTVSSYQTNSPYCPGSYAVDGDLSTRWASAWSDPQWIYVDLGKTNPLDTVSIYWEAAAAQAYTVQLANSASGPWTVVYSTTNSTAGLKNIQFPSQNARFVKVNGTARTTTYGYSIYELQVYGGGATNTGGGTAPPAPTNLTASAVSSSQINLSWSASSGATSYNVKRATVSGGPYATIATGVTATSYSDTGLSASTTYYYVVSAVNSAGESPNSSEKSATTLVAIPPAPTGLTATAVSSSQINLSWSASTGATSYNVKQATVSGGPYTTIASGVTATNYSNTGLTPSTTYYYVVSAVNTSGESPNSSEKSATTSSGGGVVLLSQGRPVTVSSFQAGNAPTNGNDGNFSTRWAAANGTYPQWWRVDLGAIHSLQSVSNYWYNSGSRHYQYQIQVSNDDTNYMTVVNKTNNVTNGNTSDAFSATNRYVRIYVTGASAGYASFYECQVFGQ
jgi:hypothetical protein